MNNIDINSFRQLLMSQKLNIIDIRQPYLYASAHIPGAINLDQTLLLTNPAKYLSRENKYYIYCDSGSKSGYVVQKLNSLGYNTVNISGGFNNYLLKR